MVKNLKCKQCENTSEALLVRDITNSGVSNVYWLCSKCQGHAQGAAQWISHRKLTDYGIVIDDLPIIQDGRSDLCIVCGQSATEYHHWAPRHIFGDESDLWPGAFLCKIHHDQWHQMVTPNMYKIRNHQND